MKIEINITKTHFFLIATIMALLAAGVLTIAYGSGHTADYVGHTVNELEIGTVDNIKVDKTNCAWTGDNSYLLTCPGNKVAVGWGNPSDGGENNNNLIDFRLYCCDLQ